MVVLRGVPPVHRPRVAAWWRQLDPASRADLRERWGCSQGSEEPEFALLGVFVDDATACEDQIDDAMWSRDFREYVTAHEDLVFHVPGRTFHICRAHPSARAVVEAGVIPAGFACPLGRAACPLVEAGSTRLGAAMHLVPVRIGPPRHPATPLAAPAAGVRSVPDGLSERGATDGVRVRGCVHHRS